MVGGIPFHSSMRVSDSFLLDRFKAFHAEILSERARISAASSSEIDAKAVGARLADFLEREAADVMRIGGSYGAKMYREAQYVMAALADEIFIHGFDWLGAVQWRSNLVETKLFMSHDAGDRFFDNLDRLLSERDPGSAELACIYLFSLKLGFQGRYRHAGNSGELDAYRVKLFALVANRKPDVAGRPGKIFPGAYARTLENGSDKRLPHVGRWISALAVSVGLYVAVSHLLWTRATEPLSEILKMIP